MVSSVGAFDDAVTDLWQRRATQLRFAVRRDARFLNWRYGDVPGKDYIRLELRGHAGQLRAYCVLSRLSGRDVCVIADLLADRLDVEAVSSVLNAALLLARERGASKVFAVATEDEVIRTLRACGFMKSRYQCRLTCVPMDRMATALKDSANWYVTMGDSDEE